MLHLPWRTAVSRLPPFRANAKDRGLPIATIRLSGLGDPPAPRPPLPLLPWSRRRAGVAAQGCAPTPAKRMVSVKKNETQKTGRPMQGRSPFSVCVVNAEGNGHPVARQTPCGLLCCITGCKPDHGLVVVRLCRSTVPSFVEKQAHPFVPLDNLGSAGAAAGLPLIGRHKASRSLLCFAFMQFLACVMAIQVAAPSRAEDRPSCTDRYAAFMAEAARRFNIPAHWIRDVMHAESAGDSRAVSMRAAWD
jgi:hypothetical protein